MSDVAFRRSSFAKILTPIPCGLTAIALLGCIGFGAGFVTSAEARHRHAHQHSHLARQGSHHHASHAASGGETPASVAAIVVDANSGHTLYAHGEHELRHPASITKVMTLYLLFEQLEQGHLRLDSAIHVSPHAAAQKPTKLGLHAGSSISVEDAIRAVVTRSANDMAVAIAETVGGDEETFAGMMTRKAHMLGMSRTHFENASGLPNDAQVTTAHDLAILGRAIQDRFPRYYPYFSTHVFHYAGQEIRNHNHLLDQVEGMDGIKTGYTRASGFNLLTSVKRGGHSIVAAVLGGVSAGARDRIMARLIENQIDNGATTRSVGLLTENTASDRLARSGEELPPELRRISMPMPPRTSLLGDAKAANAGKPDAANAPIRLASMSNELPMEKPRPAYIAGTASQPEHGQADRPQAAAKAGDGSTARLAIQANTGKAAVTPAGNRAQYAKAELTQILKAETSKAETAKKETSKESEPASPLAHSAVAPHGWVIQIGATDDVAKATALLSRAKTEGSRALANAQPYTEKVRKGSETLYRARFAGLAEESAEAACKTLKRSGFSCFATKN
ncbi:serine hydrolase [Beijerinckia indica]|uniref:Serine-type D-Ala-D-Ala carboxypeptidase n=1 Tax=Beijerinckia indica subsp. indica (strain ATCC 9039 / DSM 1715 / NCIMB 8712) TaxID=395963 RepID=B2IC46_BEII9|nr:serine hydrolase [Beijerinckia indica]ACB95301.1 Serine-type D-Ala-D-Ala carboxypeptidase [Beijerinckia indica subsp. indica ATCC 9039]